jgi:hypothetical protein
MRVFESLPAVDVLGEPITSEPPVVTAADGSRFS